MAVLLAVPLAVIQTVNPPAQSTSSDDPLAIFAPDVTVSAKDRQALDNGDTIVRLLHAKDKELAVFVAMSVGVDGDRLVSWVRQIAQLRRSQYVLSINRFSSPPRLEDLATLSLDDSDLDAIHSCRPQHCGLKLTAAEMTRLQGVISGRPQEWKPRLQDEFRRLMLDRAERYLSGGSPALGAYEDKDRPRPLDATFSTIVSHTAFLGQQLPTFASYLDQFPHVTLPGVETFLYWSKDKIGGKAQVSVTQVAILRGGADRRFDALVAAKQVAGTHYVDASLSITAVLADPDSAHHYLAYVNRSDVDAIGGFFGSIVRLVVEHRLKGEAPALLKDLRKRLESGEPQLSPSLFH